MYVSPSAELDIPNKAPGSPLPFPLGVRSSDPTPGVRCPVSRHLSPSLPPVGGRVSAGWRRGSDSWSRLCSGGWGLCRHLFPRTPGHPSVSSQGHTPFPPPRTRFLVIFPGRWLWHLCFLPRSLLGTVAMPSFPRVAPKEKTALRTPQPLRSRHGSLVDSRVRASCVCVTHPFCASTHRGGRPA